MGHRGEPSTDLCLDPVCSHVLRWLCLLKQVFSIWISLDRWGKKQTLSHFVGLFSAQSNLHTRGAHYGETHSRPLQNPTSFLCAVFIFISIGDPLSKVIWVTVTQNWNGFKCCCFQTSFQHFREISPKFYFSTQSCKELKILSRVAHIWVQGRHENKYTWSLFEGHCHANIGLCITESVFFPRTNSIKVVCYVNMFCT